MKHLAIALMVLAAFAAQTNATAIPSAATIVQITATSGDFSGTFSEVFPAASQAGFDGKRSFSLPAAVPLSAGGRPLATIEGLNVTYDADPQIDLNFAITNSSPTDPVMFNISTATIQLNPGLMNATAAAIASITATDGAIDSDTDVTLTGLFDGGKLYQARYSSDPNVNTQTVFANLVDGTSFSFGGSADESEPMANIGAVYMMEAEFKFGLSAGDQATGSSTFLVIPEPGSLMLLAFGGFLIQRRRNA